MLCAKYDYKMDIAVKQEEAFKQGKTEGKTEVAKNALKMKMPAEQIAQMTGLTIEEIQSLEK